MPAVKNPYWPPALIYAEALIIAAVTFYFARFFYVDDSYISLTFAQNLLAGHGLSWSGGEHIEGYTNFLFIMLTAGLGWLGMDLMLASRIISFAAFFGVIVLVMREVISYGMPSYAHRVCVALTFLIIASSTPLIAWSFGGLESNLFAFFLTFAIVLVLDMLKGKTSRRRALLTGIFFALATLTRPDGAVFCAIALGFLGLLWLHPRTRSRIHLFHLILAGTIFTAILLPYTLWRISYFGDFFPNTYYAKTYGIDRTIIFSRGFAYITQYLLMPPLIWPIISLMAYWLWRLKSISLPIIFLLCFACGFLAYITLVGGDFMPYARFMVPMVPVAALLFYHCGHRLLVRSAEAFFRIISTLLICFAVFQGSVIRPEITLSTGLLSSLAVRDYIESHWPKQSLIALNPAGTLPYTEPNYRYIDMLGLLDKTIARRIIGPKDMRAPGQIYVGHVKGDGSYVLSRKPDYIIFGHAWGAREPMFLSDMEIAENPAFKQNYREVETWITPPPELLAEIKKIDQRNKLILADGGKKVILGLKLNDKEQLRFIYFEQKK